MKKRLDLMCDEGVVNVQDNEGNTPLHIACLKGDQETATYFTSKFQCNFDLLNHYQCLPLHYAVSHNKALELVKIVSKCKLMHVLNSDGMTPLHIACKNEDKDVVKYLVFNKKCFPREISDIYDTLDIHFVCEDKENIDLLRALANESNVNSTFSQYNIPLHVAHYDKPVLFANRILHKNFVNYGTPQHLAYYNTPVDVAYYNTALHVACKHCNHLAVKVLLELYSDIMLCKDSQGRLPFHIACSESLECVKVMSPYATNEVVNACDHYRDTPLHIAFENNQLDIVEYLLSTFECNLGIKNSDETLPLHMACRTTLHLVTIIMEKSTSQNVSIFSTNCQTRYDRDTPLHIAFKFRALDIVKYLMKSFDCKPSMRLRNKEGKLPVDYACEHSLEMVKLVSQPCTVEDLVMPNYEYAEIYSELNYNMLTDLKPTTLEIACVSGSLDTVKYLIKEKGCTISALKNNQSALLYACGLLPDSDESIPRPEIVQFLINECGYNPDMTISNTSLFQYCCQIDNLPLIKSLTVHQVDHRDSVGNTPLHYACIYECVDIVEYLVDCGCNQDIINSEGDSPLHIACHRSLKVTKLLKNCNVNLKNANNVTALHLSCASKKEDIVRCLVEEMNCDVNIKYDEGEYALHIACINSLKIESLVQRSDINCQDDYGDTPLHNACYMRDSDMIQFLLSYQECRADILNEDGHLALHVIFMSYQSPQKRSLKYSHQHKSSVSLKILPQMVDLVLKRYPAAAITTNHDGFTPLDTAIYECNLELLELLLNVSEVDDIKSLRLVHKACKSARPEVVRWLIAHGASSDDMDEDNNFPQHLCFMNKQGDFCLRSLMHLGSIDIRKQDINNDTILHLACRRKSEDLLKYILQTLDNFEETFAIRNISKETPLHVLARSKIGSPETLKLIRCENPNSQNMSGNTALHLACQHGYFELAEHLLIKCKCDPNVTNHKGELPLHIAVAQSQLKVIKLLASPENVNKCTNKGKSPLHISCKKSDLNATKLLLDIHCNPNTLNKKGNTPLHVAAAKSLDIVKLVATPDNAKIQNADGDTPLHIACHCRDLNITLYLLKEHKCSVEFLSNNLDSVFHILMNNLSYHYSPTELQTFLLSYIPQHIKDSTNKSGDTILLIACGQPHYDVPKYLVKRLRCNVDVVNQYSGATPLHFACDEGSLQVVKLVSKCNQTTQIRDVSYLPKERKFVSGDTPLHVACRKGNIDVIRHLLRSGHSKALNYPNDLKELPIHLAIAANQSYQLIDLFISRKDYFDCNATMEPNGDTVLHIMCRLKPSFTCVTRLVNKLKCKVDVQNKEGNLPLHIACQNQHICNDSVKVLCDALSYDHIKLQNKHGNTALQEFLTCQHNTYSSGNFHLLLQIFTDRGLLPNQTIDNHVLGYLHMACRHQKVDIVKYLCEKYTSLIEFPISLLHEACLNYNERVLEYMLFDVNIPTINGDLPLHLAAKTKVCIQSTNLLIRKTKDINYKNNQGETPLHALYSGDKTFSSPSVLLEFLKVEGIDLSAVNADGCTPLHCMCRAGKFDDLITVLRKKRKINANMQDKNGETLLHFACKANNFEAVELLLKLAKANPSIEDRQKQAPITLTTDPGINKLLMKCGADPQPLSKMHKDFFERFSCEKPPPTPVKLLVIGYPSVGKTTLIQSLQNELSEEVISDHFDHTAGIVTTNFSSQHYGVVTFYDFAGQAEYYASHDAVLHSTIKNVPPVVLILVNLNESTKSILNQTKYWIGVMANRCSGLGSEAAHMILVGSHADIFESRGRNPSEMISQLQQSVTAQLEKKNIILKGTVYLNCTKSKSSEMSKLQHLLQQSTSGLREKGVMDFNSHCFYVLLLQMFQNSNVVTLGRILSVLKSKSKDVKDSPLFALPSDRRKVIEMCHDLNEKGHIMFIEHPTIIDMSWLILDKAPLLHEILGTLFSPTDFPQHHPFSYSTGVVPLSQFERHLCTNHSYPSTLSLSFLSRMEYCGEIKDSLVLKSIVKEEEFSKLDRYFFFPHLVSLERPNDVWKNTESITYKSGWLIQCHKDGECFSPHFIQALLLRLIFSFTPKKEADEFVTDEDVNIFEEKENQIKKIVIKRSCSVWKNGIYWLDDSGVNIVVDIINQTTLVLLMQCSQDCEMDLVERRSSIISMVLSAKDEFCSKAKLREYFLHPKVVTHPLPNLTDLRVHLFPFYKVVKSITEKRTCVINDQNELINLKDLLYFEPFSELSKCVSMAKYTHELCEEQISIFRGRNPPQGI